MMEKLGLISVSNWDEFTAGDRTAVEVNTQALDELRKQVDEYTRILNEELVPGTEWYNETQRMVIAAQRDISNLYKE
jgi:hypothetical protein